MIVLIKKTAHNSGLLQWLLPEIPKHNPLLYRMFRYICNGLVLLYVTYY